MNATEAKTLLGPIPPDDFLIGLFTDEVSKCCAIGHLRRLKSADPSDYDFFNCKDWSELDGADGEVRAFVRDSVRDFTNKKYGIPSDMSDVNNFDTVNGYTEDNPKDRVMHLLDDMIAAGY